MGGSDTSFPYGGKDGLREWDPIIETLRVRGLVLLAMLVVITALAGMGRWNYIESAWLGGILTIAILLAMGIEGKMFPESGWDRIGIVVLGITTLYTALEAGGITQGAWFPLATGIVLLISVTYEFWRTGTKSSEKADINNIDISGLIGSELLFIYAIIYMGGQLEFIYTPYFPGVALAFGSTVFGIMAVYATRTTTQALDDNILEPGRLHARLLSIIEKLDDADDEMLEEVKHEIERVSRSIRGIEIPTTVKVDGATLEVILPKIYPENDYNIGSFRSLISEMRVHSTTGYVVDSHNRVVFFDDGEPVKYFADGKFRSDLDEDSLEGNIQVFEVSESVFGSLEAITPNVRIESVEMEWKESVESINTAAESLTQDKENVDIENFLPPSFIDNPDSANEGE